MCEKFYQSSVSVIHLAMRGDRKVAYHAFCGYLLWAKSLQGARRLHMLIAARQAYEAYKVIQVRQDEVTEIFNIQDLEAAA